MLDKKRNNAMSLIMLGICKRIQNKFNTQLTINTIIKKPNNSFPFFFINNSTNIYHTLEYALTAV